MTDGYVYCFSNESMPGILKVGMTERTPTIRLGEANSSDTWRPPTPYKIEFAKKVANPKHKETILHTLLSQYTDRINPKREFFRVSPENVKTFFELMDGPFWIDPNKPVEDSDDDMTISQLMTLEIERKKTSDIESEKKRVSKFFENFTCPLDK